MKKTLHIFQIVLTIFVCIGAVGGAIMMWTDPAGVSWGGEPMLDLLRSKMPWPDVFFRNFIPSGFVLLAVNGLPQFLAAVLLLKKRPVGYPAVLVCGIILMLWIVLEWWIWGFVALSNVFFVVGLAELAAAVASMKLEKS